MNTESIKIENKNIMIIAAEASSAHYAAQLMREWQKKNHVVNKKIHFTGVGSNEMEALGQRRIGKSEEMAVMGIAEIIEHYSFLKKIFYQLISEAEKNRPDIVLLMDYPDFNLRLARQLKSMGIKVFYYISPQVWAWRKSRIHDIKAYCEKVFLLFPFEKKFYETYQVPYEFVGHPLLDDLNPDLFNIDKINFQRSRYGIQSHEKVLALMPGSRRGEVDQHFQIQQAVARNLLKMHNHLRILICVAPPLSKEYMIQKLENFNLPYILLKEDPNHMIAISDYVLVASGTATLMVGLLEKPMVIMYKMNWITGVIGNFLTRGLKFFGLVNLILDEEVVPERKQQFVQVDELTKLMNRFIVDSTYTRKTIEKLKILKTSLGDRGANGRVVSALNKYL